MDQGANVQFGRSRAIIMRSFVDLFFVGILITFISTMILQVSGQGGFLNYDCGGSTQFNDVQNPGLIWDGDQLHKDIIDTGSVATITTNQTGVSPELITLRYFPDKSVQKFCYQVKVESNVAYFVRGRFLHGAYDNTTLNDTATGSLTVGIELDGVNLQKLIMTNSTVIAGFTFILSTKLSVMAICLLRNSARENPFISSLELKKYFPDMYPQCTKDGLILTVAGRSDHGSLQSFRYPTDPYDRTWQPVVNVNTEVNSSIVKYVNTSGPAIQDVNPQYPLNWNRPAAAAMLNGLTSAIIPAPLTFRFAGFQYNLTYAQTFFVIMYFAELDPTVQVGDRVFDILLNGTVVFPAVDILNSTNGVIYKGIQLVVPVPSMWGNNELFYYTLRPTNTSKFGPLINAAEGLGYSRRPPSPGTKARVGWIVGFVVGGAALVLVCLVLGWLVAMRVKRKSRADSNDFSDKPVWTPVPRHNSGVDVGGGTYKEVRRYSHNQVIAMTNNWKVELGKGGFGTVYLGELPQDNKSSNSIHQLPQKVALKKLSRTSQQGNVEFLNEVDLLSRIHHSKLVSLVGFCEGPVQVLIYEYVEEGTLDEWLYGAKQGNPRFTWNCRLHIALDAALGLEYLHTGAKPNIIHRDVKSSNILLTKDLEGRLADFGLSKTGSDTENKGHVSTMVKGTIGYLDPEYYGSAQLTNKSDVYSFGVVLLEMVTARRPLDTSVVNPEYRSIAKYVELHYPEHITAVVDKRMPGDYSIKSMRTIVDVALKSLAMSSLNRPSMSDVVIQIRDAIKYELLETPNNDGGGDKHFVSADNDHVKDTNPDSWQWASTSSATHSITSSTQPQDCSSIVIPSLPQGPLHARD